MKIFLRIVGVLVVLVVAFFLFGFLLPREISVERTVTIDLPPGQVYPLVVDLKRWPDWQAWNKEMDPTVAYEFSEPSVGEGAWYEWNGEKLSTGKVAITGVTPDRSVDYTVDFAETGANPGTMKLEPADGDKTTATWSFDCDMGFSPIGRYFGLMMGDMLEADFDKGLANLKKLAETEKPAPLPSSETATPDEEPAERTEETPTESPAPTDEPSAAETTPESAREPVAPRAPEDSTDAAPTEPSSPENPAEDAASAES